MWRRWSRAVRANLAVLAGFGVVDTTRGDLLFAPAGMERGRRGLVSGTAASGRRLARAVLLLSVAALSSGPQPGGVDARRVPGDGAGAAAGAIVGGVLHRSRRRGSRSGSWTTSSTARPWRSGRSPGRRRGHQPVDPMGPAGDRRARHGRARRSHRLHGAPRQRDGRCPTADATCHVITVQRDQVAADPRGATLEITYAVCRRPAERGTLLFIDGGPGESGLLDANYFIDGLPDRSASHYDVLAFDPRGTGAPSCESARRISTGSSARPTRRPPSFSADFARGCAVESAPTRPGSRPTARTTSPATSRRSARRSASTAWRSTASATDGSSRSATRAPIPTASACSSSTARSIRRRARRPAGWRPTRRSRPPSGASSTRSRRRRSAGATCRTRGRRSSGCWTGRRTAASRRRFADITARRERDARPGLGHERDRRRALRPARPVAVPPRPGVGRRRRRHPARPPGVPAGHYTDETPSSQFTYYATLCADFAGDTSTDAAGYVRDGKAAGALAGTLRSAYYSGTAVRRLGRADPRAADPDAADGHPVPGGRPERWRRPDHAAEPGREDRRAPVRRLPDHDDRRRAWLVRERRTLPRRRVAGAAGPGHPPGIADRHVRRPAHRDLHPAAPRPSRDSRRSRSRAPSTTSSGRTRTCATRRRTTIQTDVGCRHGGRVKVGDDPDVLRLTFDACEIFAGRADPGHGGVLRRRRDVRPAAARWPARRTRSTTPGARRSTATRSAADRSGRTTLGQRLAERERAVVERATHDGPATAEVADRPEVGRRRRSRPTRSRRRRRARPSGGRARDPDRPAARPARSRSPRTSRRRPRRGGRRHPRHRPLVGRRPAVPDRPAVADIDGDRDPVGTQVRTRRPARSGSARAAVPMTARAAPPVRAVSTACSSRSPPATSTAVRSPTAATIAAMTSAWAGVPVRAPSRSTTCSQRAPAAANRSATPNRILYFCRYT